MRHLTLVRASKRFRVWWIPVGIFWALPAVVTLTRFGHRIVWRDIDGKVYNNWHFGKPDGFELHHREPGLIRKGRAS